MALVPPEPAASQLPPRGAAGVQGHHPPQGRAGGAPPLTVVHEGFAVPVESLRAPRTALPQGRLLDVGRRLGLQPAPARQGDDAHDDGQPQQQGQEPPAPPAGEAAHHHAARPAEGEREGGRGWWDGAPGEPERGGWGGGGGDAPTGRGDCVPVAPSGFLRRRGRRESHPHSSD